MRIILAAFFCIFLCSSNTFSFDGNKQLTCKPLVMETLNFNKKGIFRDLSKDELYRELTVFFHQDTVEMSWNFGKSDPVLNKIYETEYVYMAEILEDDGWARRIIIHKKYLEMTSITHLGNPVGVIVVSFQCFK